MENNVKITFWLNKTKKNSKNLTPIYLRVTQNYDFFIKSTGVWIHAGDWDKKGMRIKGSSSEINTANTNLDALRMKVMQVVNQLIVQGKPFNVHTIRKTLEGNEIEKITLMRAYDEQLAEMQKLLNKDYAPATLIKYRNTQLRLKQFIKQKFHRSDMFLYELNYQFMGDFESFLKQKFNNSNVTVYKHYQRFTRVINKAMHKGYLEKNPFQHYKIKMVRKKIQYLTQEEVDRIEQTNFRVERLNIIRDVFIFSIYSGLAYSECESLVPEDITTGMDGGLWLQIHRKKTKRDYQVPLLPKAQAIIDKYSNHPASLKKGKCLPVPSNVKYNAYLKEIADLAGIPKSKPLVTHLARKTFACTIALSNGMNISVLSKLLGHNSIKVTLDSYAAVIDELMLKHVKELKDKLTPAKERFIITEVDRLSDPHDELLFQVKNSSKN